MARHDIASNQSQSHNQQQSHRETNPQETNAQGMNAQDMMTVDRFLLMTNFYTTDMHAVTSWAMPLIGDRRVSPYVIRAAREFMLGNTADCIHCCESASMSYRKARHNVLSILRALDESVYSKALKELPTP